MREILHVDLNNFFASVECMDYPSLRNVPVAVCGSTEARHGIVLAKNQIAKARGIKTGMVNWEAMRLCPDLICVKPNMDKYIECSRKVRHVYAQYTDQIEPYGIDECWLDVTGSRHLFGSGGEIAERIRREVKSIIGLTVSVGVSFNKIFAKLGSDYKKPDAVTVFSRENYMQTVWPIAVEELLFVGRATQDKLNGIGIHTIGDLAKTDCAILESKLGKVGAMLWSYANGYDQSPVIVQGERVPIKSVGNSSTTPRDLENNDDVRLMIYTLSETVASRMREQGFRCQIVEIWVRDITLVSFVRQRKMRKSTCLTEDIAKEAYKLFLENYDWHAPIRSIGVRAGCLSDIEGVEQTTLFEEEKKNMSKEQLALSVDRLRKRYGYNTILRGISISDKTLPIISPEDARRLGAGMYEMTPQR